MKQWIGEILDPVSQNFYTWIAAIPMWMVQALVFGIFVLLALWVLLLPPQLPVKGEESKVLYLKDLRLFALFVLVLQIVLYIIF